MKSTENRVASWSPGLWKDDPSRKYMYSEWSRRKRENFPVMFNIIQRRLELNGSGKYQLLLPTKPVSPFNSVVFPRGTSKCVKKKKILEAHKFVFIWVTNYLHRLTQTMKPTGIFATLKRSHSIFFLSLFFLTHPLSPHFIPCLEIQKSPRKKVKITQGNKEN